MSKDFVSDLEITNKTDKCKNLWKEMDDMYQCVRTLTIDNDLINKKKHIQSTM